MSRVGKKIITLPQGVTATVADRLITVTGPKGTLKRTLVPQVRAKVDADGILIELADASAKKVSALWGTTRAVVQNMVTGVKDGFTKGLEINGVGFKAALQGKKLILNVGFSHPVEYVLPEGIVATVEKNVITVSGIDREVVGQTAAEIRDIKKPEPYKGKGIKYTDEVIRRKVGKVMKSAA